MAFTQKPKKTDIKPKSVTLNKYSITLEIEAPVQLEFKIQAETPEKALELIEKNLWKNLESPPSIQWNRLKKKYCTICKQGTSTIIHKKDYR